MKIAFTGAQCTGKSTQVRLLEDYLVVESASRVIAREGLPVNRCGDLTSQMCITGRMELDMHRTKDLDYVVWERTHVDSYAYATSCKLGPARNSYLDIVEQLAKKQFEEYFDLVFLFPAYTLDDFVDVCDGVRDCDEEYRLFIHSTIVDMLSFLGVDYLTVPMGTIEERRLFIDSQIKLAEHQPIIERLESYAK